MNLLIKGMDMPKNCYYCRFNYDNLCHALQLSFSYIHENDISCPLSEFPTPYVRLIDADRLYETIEQMEGFGTIDNENDVVLSAVEVLTAIDEAPTIIEAEE